MPTIHARTKDRPNRRIDKTLIGEFVRAHDDAFRLRLRGLLLMRNGHTISHVAMRNIRCWVVMRHASFRPSNGPAVQACSTQS